MLASAFTALCRVFTADRDFTAVLAVPGRNPVTPPKLTGDTPVTDVFHPVEVNLVEAFGDKLRLAVLDCLDGRFGKRLHLHEPLLGNSRFNNRMTAVAGTDFMLGRLDFNKCTGVRQVFDNRLAALHEIHTGIFACLFIHEAVVGHDVDNRQVVSESYFKVVRVVRRGNFNRTGSLVHFCVRVGNNRDFTSDDGNHNGLSDYVLVAFIIGVNGNGGIAGNRFGTGGCDLNIAAPVLERIFEVPEIAVVLFIFNLGVGNRGLTVRTPVDDPFAPVNQSLFIEITENLTDSLRAAFVKREAFSFPVAGGAHFLKLFDNSSAVLCFPFPRSF